MKYVKYNYIRRRYSCRSGPVQARGRGADDSDEDVCCRDGVHVVSGVFAVRRGGLWRPLRSFFRSWRVFGHEFARESVSRLHHARDEEERGCAEGAEHGTRGGARHMYRVLAYYLFMYCTLHYLYSTQLR